MAWEKVITGYIVRGYFKTDIIPNDAKFLYAKDEFQRMVGFISNPKPYYETVFYYQLPIYGNKNIKRK